MDWDLWGLVAPVKVRHVYAAHCVCVELLDSRGELSGLWCTVRLPITPPTALRSSECPPRLPLRLYDPEAPEHGDTSSPQPGPCPRARGVLQRWLRDASRVVVHLPLGQWTMQEIAASRTVPGDLFISRIGCQGVQDPNQPGSPASCYASLLGQRVSGLLIAAGIAQPIPHEAPYAPTA